MVTVEHPAAYTDGSPRFEQVFVADAAVRGKTPEQVRQAVKDAVEDDPIGQLVGAAIAQPTQTKAVYEERCIALFETWRRWQLTRLEAQTRAMAPGVITALTNRENIAWGEYAAGLNAWRGAP